MERPDSIIGNAPSSQNQDFESIFIGFTNGLTGKDQSRKEKVLAALGLADENERIGITEFRRVIHDHLNINDSFMFKRTFNAADTERKGYLTPEQFVSLISILLHGPFESQVELALRVYGKPSVDKENPEAVLLCPSSFTISKSDAIASIVESLQLSSPRARHTLTTNTREKAYKVGEELVDLIFSKLDVDLDGVISYYDFLTVCKEDPSLIQVFGQFLPKNGQLSYCPPKSALPKTAQRPRTSNISTFEGIDFLKHSPTMGTMWGRTANKKAEPSGSLEKSERLLPIPLVHEDKVKKANKTKQIKNM